MMIGRHAARQLFRRTAAATSSNGALPATMTQQHARKHPFHTEATSSSRALLFCGAVAGIAAVALADNHPTVARADIVPSMILVKQPLETRYCVEKTLGRGGFAHVVAGREKLSDTPVAIKRVSKALTSKAKFIHEVAILEQLQGTTHVIQLKDAFETPEDWILVTDYVAGGELFERLVATGTFAERDAKAITRELAAVLIDLHAQRLVHGDVKPENILLDADSAPILIDFGLSFRAGEGRHPWDGSGTVAYSAPEVLSNAVDATTAIDMWALGVVLFIVLGGYHPFDPTNELDDRGLRAAILRGEFAFDDAAWSGISDDARDLIRQLVVVDPAARLTAAQVLAHPWLTAQDE
ncbi:Aste57867_9256 [Aphanomyces stellatus]|uniref:Aste57867_9256 protein n=1 Tax=Aphanomyces stellatus TaxID=120398 RepID=A0A485KMK3_9STRA|nr:hypothetical protein As57867_009220 [Aphanomyces stellatus]VFT86139.1 Aste57867_9256 [Aphanomyces stellatus]